MTPRREELGLPAKNAGLPATMGRMNEQVLPDLGRFAGIVTAAELSDVGITKASVRAMVARGALTPVCRGTYARGHVAREVVDRPGGERALRIAAMVVAAGLGAVASHQDAALLYGLNLLDRPSTDVSITRPAVPAAEPGGQESIST